MSQQWRPTWTELKSLTCRAVKKADIVEVAGNLKGALASINRQHRCLFHAGSCCAWVLRLDQPQMSGNAMFPLELTSVVLRNCDVRDAPCC